MISLDSSKNPSCYTFQEQISQMKQSYVYCSTLKITTNYYKNNKSFVDFRKKFRKSFKN